MLANYGYSDGSGEYYITINTDGCLGCKDHPCVDACPMGMFEVIEDDYDDLVAMVVDERRRALKYDCSECKPSTNPPPLPCVSACQHDAISHSW